MGVQRLTWIMASKLGKCPSRAPEKHSLGTGKEVDKGQSLALELWCCLLEPSCHTGLCPTSSPRVVCLLAFFTSRLGTRHLLLANSSPQLFLPVVSSMTASTCLFSPIPSSPHLLSPVTWMR